MHTTHCPLVYHYSICITPCPLVYMLTIHCPLVYHYSICITYCPLVYATQCVLFIVHWFVLVNAYYSLSIGLSLLNLSYSLSIGLCYSMCTTYCPTHCPLVCTNYYWFMLLIVHC